MEQTNTYLASNLQNIRESRNLSLDKLSEITGVSKSMLRQIEIGQSNPTIGTIWKIANGLRIPFTSLLRDQSPDVSVRAFKQEAPLFGETQGYRVYPLVVFNPERAYEMYYVEMDPGSKLDAEPHPDNAEEKVFVMRGQLDMLVNDLHFVVQPEEFISFQANCKHQYHNKGVEMIVAIMTITYLP